jgi:hypothetical protein
MCGTPIWGIAALAGCLYLAHLSWARVQRGEVAWAGDGWTLLTHAVWIVLMGGLFLETRCLRERVFFAVVLLNFALGLTLGVWHSLAEQTARSARLLVVGLWTVAAITGALTMGRGANRV